MLYIFRPPWLRLLLGFVAPLNYFFVDKGENFARSISPLTISVALLVAVVSTAGFVVSPHLVKPSLFACWYRYGDSQVIYDLVLLVVLLLIKGAVLIYIACYPAIGSDSSTTNTTKKKT